MAKQFRNINIETGRVEGAYSSGNGNRITNVAPDPGLLITSISASVPGDDLVGDGEAQARSILLGGEERVEDVFQVLLGDAAARCRLLRSAGPIRLLPRSTRVLTESRPSLPMACIALTKRFRNICFICWGSLGSSGRLRLQVFDGPQSCGPSTPLRE